MSLKCIFSMKTLAILVSVVALALTWEHEEPLSCGYLTEGGKKFASHINKSGPNRCCVQLKCLRGTEPKMCTKDIPNSTHCKVCPPGTYQPVETNSSDMLNCEPHIKCGEDAKVIQVGNNTDNVVCACNRDRGYYGQWPDCFSDKKCSAGSELQLTGDCKECETNFYQPNASSKPCLSCSGCNLEKQKVVTECTKVSDVICTNKTGISEPSPSGNQFIVPMLCGVFAIIIFILIVFIVVVCIVVYRKKQKKREKGKLNAASSETSSESDPKDGDNKFLIGGSPSDTCPKKNFEQCANETKTWSERDVMEVASSSSNQTPLLASEGEHFDCNLREDPSSVKNDPHSVQYEVVTEGQEGTSRDSSYNETANTGVKMKGSYNVHRGNIYVFKDSVVNFNQKEG